MSQQIPDECPRCAAELDGGVVSEQTAARVMRIGAIALVVIGTLGLLALAAATGMVDEDGFRLKHVAIALVASLLPAAIVYRIGAAMKKIKRVRCPSCPWKGVFQITSRDTIRLVIDQ
jgi:hypothetical protein